MCLLHKTQRMVLNKCKESLMEKICSWRNGARILVVIAGERAKNIETGGLKKC